MVYSGAWGKLIPAKKQVVEIVSDVYQFIVDEGVKRPALSKI